ncbi:hypothetical protein [Alicyclobacillus acidoterrestris]|uniref:Uncharacterized protein n=1 Tax=Alicyclobacillus acidoterrestris (strain ATCC 49025 / DSM 3922 / CIP 106132 / NCIMB 13137 / GD3B) TaxID=1356854 RepID=T0DCJ4_ALIAG|nr:hypothetical protein [Alicyclobacillus acidoterrestris]EPZ47391.1 hypothetical protein N007_06160 [Alicyclobacillus acidoterrestris ATCC 49025]UNO48290.1 hypothetical protein K1I37_16685 [Alicyclobacillus acidoterrestris]
MDLFLTLSRKQLGQIIGLLIALGYVDINVLTFRAGFFAFVVRGPLFSRLTSGASRYLRAPGNSPKGSLTAQTFIKLEALLAFLLLTGQAYIQNPTVVGSGIVFTVQSDLFKLQTIQSMLKERNHNELDRIILTLLNLGVGWGLMQNSFGITGVGYGSFPHKMAFSTTSVLLQPGPQRDNAGGIAALPNGGPVYRWFNRVIGFMLAIQQLYIYSISISKGGRLVFGITGNVLALRSLEKTLKPKS